MLRVGYMRELWRHMYTHRVRVERQIVDDEDQPAWENIAEDLPCLIARPSARELALSRDTTEYPQPVTHTVYVNDHAALAIGNRVVAMFERGEQRAWHLVQRPLMLMVLGRTQVFGPRAPRNQVRLDCAQVTPTAGEGY